MKLQVVFMILQPSKELKYLIDILRVYFSKVLTVHEHHNHNINQSSTIKLESEFVLDNYKNKDYLLALDSETLKYKPLVNLSKYESKDKFIIWYENAHVFRDLVERVIYTILVKTLEFDTYKKVPNYRDSISNANLHYYIKL